MDPCDTKPYFKRELKVEPDDYCHHQPNSSIGQPTKITDLDDICLENICDRLDLVDLFNVAVANERLRSAARQSYKYRFGQMKSLITSRTGSSHIVMQNDSIDVHGLRVCLQYLRCFGSSISDLWILYGKWTEKQCEHIHEYVNKYCADTLTSIMLQDISTFNPKKQFVKPFFIVQEVYVFDVDLGYQLSLFPEWFPNVNSLKLHSIRLSKRCVDVPFQHLKHLYLDISHSDGYGLSMNQAGHLVSSNNRLDSLNLFAYGQQQVTPFTLLNLIQNNRSISKVMVTMYESSTIVQSQHVERLVREHPLLVELTLRGFKFSAEGAMTLIRRLNLLTSFCFEFKDSANYDHFVDRLGQRWMPSRNGNTVILTVCQD